MAFGYRRLREPERGATGGSRALGFQGGCAPPGLSLPGSTRSSTTHLPSRWGSAWGRGDGPCPRTSDPSIGYPGLEGRWCT